MINETKQTVINRLRRKLDIMRLDAKLKQDTKLASNVSKCLALIDDVLELSDDS